MVLRLVVLILMHQAVLPALSAACAANDETSLLAHVLRDVEPQRRRPRSQVSEPSPQEDRGAVRWEGLEALETLSPGSNVPTPPKPQGPQMEAPSRETPDVPSTKLPAPSLEAPSSDASWDPRALPAGAVSPGIRALSIVPAAPDPARPTEDSSLASAKPWQRWMKYGGYGRPDGDRQRKKLPEIAGKISAASEASDALELHKLRKLLRESEKHQKELQRLTGKVNSILFSSKDEADVEAGEDLPPSIIISNSNVYGNVVGGGNSGYSRVKTDSNAIGNTRQDTDLSVQQNKDNSLHHVENIVGNGDRNVEWKHDVSMPMTKNFDWHHDVNLSMDNGPRNIQWKHDVSMPMSKDINWHHDVNMPMNKEFEWSHDVNMPVGNTKRSFDISAGDTQWRHDVFMPIGNTKKSVDVSANGTNIRHRVNTDLFDKASHRLGEIASSRLGRSSAGTDNGLDLPVSEDGLGDDEADVAGNETGSG